MNNEYVCPKCGSGELYTNVRLSVAIPLKSLYSITKTLLSSSKAKIIAAERNYDFYCLNCCYASQLKNAKRREPNADHHPHP